MIKHYILQAITSEGKSVYIDDVPNGKKCGCVCKECGGALIAKQGSIKRHHFSHANGNDNIKCNQTALHLLAKAIITEEKLIPAVFNDKITFVKADLIEQEKNLGNIIPDIYAEVDGHPIAVEIYVSHQIDDTKFMKIQNHKLTTFEINLSKVMFETKKEVREAIYDNKNLRLVYDEKLKNTYIERKKSIILNKGILKPIKNGLVQQCRLRGIIYMGGIKWNNIKSDFCKTCFLGYHTDEGVYCIGDRNFTEPIPRWFLSTDINENRLISSEELTQKLRTFKERMHNSVVL